MDHIINGLIQALKLLASLDHEIYKIIGLSVGVSFLSTLMASVIGIIVGMAMGLYEFPFKRVVVRLVYSFMALPPVVVGLFVAILISRRGPMGQFELMFTPLAMIVAQTILITPIITGLIYSAVKEHGDAIREVAHMLGGSKWDEIILIAKELKKTIAVAVTTGFGRGISEVGAVMLVGGNIKGHTRVMTTFIAMNNSMGNYAESIAMGIVLIAIAIATNTFIHRLTGDTR